MMLDHSKKGAVKVDMTDHVKRMANDFPHPIKVRGEVKTPATENIFVVNESPKLDEARAEVFHTFGAKASFVAKRGGPDVQVPIAFLCTRVRKSTEEDWNRLLRLMKFLKVTQDDALTLKADDTSIVKWCTDASFAAHPDMKSHTGITMTLGEGAIASSSKKQKMNMRSSAEAELVTADKALTQIIWTQNFSSEQGYTTKAKLFQDNTSTIQLARNGRDGAGERSRHLNIRMFFIKDCIDRGVLQVECCPAKEMDSDYMYVSKAKQGELFCQQRKKMMNHC